MRRTTRSLLVAFGSAAALVAAPLVLEVHHRSDGVAAVSAPAVVSPSSVPAVAPPAVLLPAGAPAQGAQALAPQTDLPAVAPPVVAPAAAPPITPSEVALPVAAPSSVPAVAVPVTGPGVAPSPVPRAVPPLGGEPSAASRTIEAPTDSGSTTPTRAAAGTARGGDLPPELLPALPYPPCPITEEGAWWSDPSDPYTCLRPGSMMFHEPTPPGMPPELLEPVFEDPETPPAAEDCLVAGATQCVVDTMGQDDVVTGVDGTPVGVVEAQG